VALEEILRPIEVVVVALVDISFFQLIFLSQLELLIISRLVQQVQHPLE
jgi:hypothetical protein